jgi:Mg-chelatase subunit ChlD
MQSRISRIPTRTSTDTLIRIVERVGAFYKLPVACKLDEYAKTASIDLTTNTMTLPAWLTKANLAKILFFTAHEMLHIHVMPQNAHMQAYYVAFAAELGVRAPKLLANLVFDQVVNDHGMVESPFREEFTKGCSGFYRDRASRVRKHRATQWAMWHFGNMSRRCDEIKGKRPRRKKTAPAPETLTRLYNLVFKDTRPFEKRYREVCKLTREWFNQDDDNESSIASSSPCGAGGLPPMEDPKELDEWAQKMRRLSTDSVLKGARATGNKRVLLDCAEISALEEYIISQASRTRKAKTLVGPESPEDVWTPADRVDELDLRLTLQTSGVFLPYITALKRVSGTQLEQEDEGAGLQAYVLDVSGSMLGSIDLVAMFCFAISRHAKRRRDEIAVLTFSDSDSPEFLLKPCRNYERMRPILEKLEGGGSTYLAPALVWLNEYCKRKQLKPTVIIFTDADIADEAQALRELQQTREQLRGKSILINTAHAEPSWVQAAIRQGNLETFRVNYDQLGNVRQVLMRITD